MASAWSQLDQLLTCAICLDRYRNPKLLPCQHTFCMEPCLDGLIDYARRQIKCPECRAEHRIPYKGIQEFPTNVTLMRFLELHRDITGEEPEPPPSMMERCSVCSEKANLERCAHCEKKICPDCKEAHVDILRREINRINNQVRRGLHRLSDALAQTKKNADKLQENCSQVRDEIEDIVRRYSKDLKHTEEKLKHDLEIYTESEMKSINKLKEDLEAEVSTMTSNCDLVEHHIQDNAEWSDAELLEYKEIFLKTLDFLRSFDVDTSDFSRRIKFQPRADPDVLHRNIADFGELKINAPPSCMPIQQQQQQSLAPPPTNALMRSQSDHRLAAQFARRTESRSFTDRYGGHTSDNEREPARPTSPLYGRGRRDTDSSGYRRYSDRTRDYDYDRPSNRYIKEESSSYSSRWRDSDDYSHRSRYGRDYEDFDSEPQHTSSRTVRFADEQPQRERIFDIDATNRGPLSGVVRLLDSPKIMERIHQNKVRQKPNDKDIISSSQTIETKSQPTAPSTPKKPVATRQQSEDDIDKQKKANQQQASSSSVTTAQQNTTPTRSELTSRSNTTSNTSKPSPDTLRTATTNRIQRKESSETPPARQVTSPERGDTTSTTLSSNSQVPALPENSEETESSSTSGSSSDSRCSRPTSGKALIPDSGGSTAAQSLLDKKSLTSFPTQLTTQSKRSDKQQTENENRIIGADIPVPIQSSFFSRQRRLPDPEPRLLLSQDSDDDDDDEDDDESEESSSSSSDEDEEEENEAESGGNTTGINATGAPTATSNGIHADHDNNKSAESKAESESEESSSESSATTESDSEDEEDDDPPVERDQQTSSKTPSDNNSTFDTGDDVDVKSPNSYLSPSQNYENAADDSEGIADLEINSRNRKPELSVRRYSAPTAPNSIDNGRPKFRRRSDDLDTTDSSSGSSSTNYQSFSNTPPALSNGTVEDMNGNESGNHRPSRFGRRRPILARSRSSHELGLGFDTTEDVDDDEEDADQSSYYSRSRPDKISEDNLSSVSRSRPKLGTIHGSDHYTSLDSSTSSNNNNNSWAKYLKSKYGSNATSKVVPRSRSSHSLYQRSDSESSDDDVNSGSVIPGSIGFANPRSTYMQKRRMLMKFGARGTEPGNFTWPRGIAVGPDDSIVVADSSNHRVQVFDSLGVFLCEFGSYGSCEGQFDCLSGVAVNRIGQYIVSDRYNQRVQLFDPSGRFLRAFGSEGRTDGRFNYPWGITTDSLGFIYVCDKENHRIQVFQSDGTFVGKFGSMGSRPGQLEHPHYVAVSNTNRVVVSDSNNHRIQIFDVNGRTLSTFGSEGSGEGQFKFPRGVAVDDQGYIIVGDSGNNRIQIFQADGSFLRSFGCWGSGDGEFKGLEGIAVTSSGTILVCDRENHRIQVF